MLNQDLISTLFGVLNITLLIATVFYLSVGTVGYLRFGDTVASTITLNMPRDQLLFMAVIPLYAISIFFSYGLLFYLIAVYVVEALARSPYLVERPHLMTAIDAILRVAFVLLICMHNSLYNNCVTSSNYILVLRILKKNLYYRLLYIQTYSYNICR